VKIIPRSWSIYTIAQRQTKINPRPQYQRAPVWNIPKKQKLIDSILRGYDIPKLYLRESSDPDYEHEVVDGQQRLRAIWEFRNDSYELGDESTDLPMWGDLSGLRHSQLPSEVQDRLGLFELNVVIIEDSDELEIRDLFLRLQEGVTLNPAEKRNAMPGEMRDFVANTASHKVFQCVHMSSNIARRYGKDDWLAHILCFELAEGPTDLKATNLKKMYESHTKFDGPMRAKSKRFIRILNLMAKILRDNPAEMDIKWGFVDLYGLVSTLDKEYVLAGREDDLATFYVTFEQRRRSVTDTDELARSIDPLDRSLFSYIESFVRSGAVKRNVGMRQQVYREWIHNLLPDLVPKDGRRSYTRDERLIIWRRDNQACMECGKSVDFDDMHADHVVPHSTGGQTTLSNAQCLCTKCNQQKSSRV